MIFTFLIILGIVYWMYKSDKKESILEGGYSNDNYYKIVEESSNFTKPTEVTLKDPILDTSRIINHDNSNLPKFEFRPQTFEQFIGQQEAKDRAETIIKKVRRGMKSHIIISGGQGLGKTSFINILAKSIPAKLITRIGSQVEEDETINLINEINTSNEDFVMLFIDEIDSMKPAILKQWNSIVESFTLANKGIKPFIFACATINKHKLIKKNPDFLDRLPHPIIFDKYNSDEINSIITQYKEQLYPDKSISTVVMNTISKNCKFNPRISISLLEDYLIEKNIDKVLLNSKIVKDGLTTIDIDILKVLNSSKRPMGANALATKIKISELQYTTEFEPFLVAYDYINRVPSRIISDKGKELLSEINEL
jgi:Holliday junction resolvasome RuvABC ATP-dependent DNA helicase subunit